MTLQEAAKNDYELPSTFVQIDIAVEKKEKEKTQHEGKQINKNNLAFNSIFDNIEGVVAISGTKMMTSINGLLFMKVRSNLQKWSCNFST